MAEHPPAPNGDGLIETSADPRLRTTRGETVIAPQVVETIAQRAAGQTPGVAEVVPDGGGLRRFLHIGGHTQPTSASAEIAQHTTDVTLTVHVAYTAPVFETAEQVRANVMRELRRQTGLEATRVDIVIPKLVVGGFRARPRVR